MDFAVDFLYRKYEMKMFAVTVCDRKIRKENYVRR